MSDGGDGGASELLARHKEVMPSWLVLYYDELLGALGLDSAALVGHSFGGMVAAEIAASFPSRVDTRAVSTCWSVEPLRSRRSASDFS